jgi:Mrp family chromosome partitioning ATPase
VVPPVVQPPVEQAPRLRPLFEVEKLPWPRVCGSLVQAAEKDLDHVADELIAGGRAGRKLVLVAANRRGEGCTMTLLCLARQLSARGHAVALVDADFQQAQLVRQVKLLPQAGWENVLRGEVPLEEALIEAVGDRITILPLMAPLIEHEAVVCRRQIAASLRRLRDEHDLVLVDSPAAADASGEMDSLLAAVKFDAAIVVRDVRTTRDNDLEALTQRLAAAGIERCDIAENFVST